MVHHLERLSTSASECDAMHTTPSSETACDNAYSRSCPPPPRREESASDQGRFIISSKLPLSGTLSIPTLVRPTSKTFAKKSRHKGMVNTVIEQQHIPSFKLAPKQSIDLRGSQLGAQLGF